MPEEVFDLWIPSEDESVLLCCFIGETLRAEASVLASNLFPEIGIPTPPNQWLTDSADVTILNQPIPEPQSRDQILKS